jgi:hypothetical protein
LSRVENKIVLRFAFIRFLNRKGGEALSDVGPADGADLIEARAYINYQYFFFQISGFRRGVDGVFAILVCCAEYFGICLQMLWNINRLHLQGCNRLSLGNYTLPDLTDLYKKNKHKRTKHMLL